MPLIVGVRMRNKVIFGIVGVMEIDVIAKEHAAHRMMPELVMHERPRKRHGQMCRDGNQDKQRKVRQESQCRPKHKLRPRS